MSPLSPEMTMQICVAPAAIIRSTKYSATAFGRSTPLITREPTGNNSFEHPSGCMRWPAPAAGMIPSMALPRGFHCGPVGNMRCGGGAKLLQIRHQLFRAARAGVLIERALAGACRHSREFGVSEIHGSDHVFCAPNDTQLFAVDEEIVEPG